MRISAIDVGSNSIHLVVVEADAVGNQCVLSREKVMVRVELTFLAPRTQEAILLGTSRQPSIQELVGIARLEDWADQVTRWQGANQGSGFPVEPRGEIPPRR